MQKNNFIRNTLICQGIILLILLAASPLFAGDNSDAIIEAIQCRIKGYTYQRQGDFQKAIEFYKKAVASNPFYACARNDLGILYEQMGKPDKAEEEYLSAIRSDENYSSAYSNLALLYERQNKIEEACYYWGVRAEMGDPSDQWTVSAQNKYTELSVLVADRQRLKRKMPKADLSKSYEELETEEAAGLARKFAVEKGAENKIKQKEDALRKDKESKEKERLRREQDRQKKEQEKKLKEQQQQQERKFKEQQQEQERLKAEQEKKLKKQQQEEQKAKEEQARLEKKRQQAQDKLKREQEGKLKEQQREQERLKAEQERLQRAQKAKIAAVNTKLKSEAELKKDAERLAAYQLAKEKEIETKRYFAAKAKEQKKQAKAKPKEVKQKPAAPSIEVTVKKDKPVKKEQKKEAPKKEITKKEAPKKTNDVANNQEKDRQRKLKEADQHFTRGQALYLSSRYQEASKEFEAALAANPNHSESSRLLRYCQRRTQTGYYRPLEESISQPSVSRQVVKEQQSITATTYKEPVVESPDAIEKRVSRELKQEEKSSSEITSDDIEKKYQIMGVVAYRAEAGGIDGLNAELLKKAKDMGAEEVIQVRYFQNNNFLYGYGTAVRKKKIK